MPPRRREIDMPKRLFVCRACQCHVKEGDAACPFCGEAVLVAREPEAPIGHLSRIAMVAMTAAVATASAMTVGCTTDDGQQGETPPTTVGDAYGVPPMREGGGPPMADAGDASFSAMYGGPPMADAGDSEPPFMAGDAYGVSPIDSGRRD
jgi:hypothetical protein